jgi:hypothetical protein
VPDQVAQEGGQLGVVVEGLLQGRQNGAVAAVGPLQDVLELGRVDLLGGGGSRVSHASSPPLSPGVLVVARAGQGRSHQGVGPPVQVQERGQRDLPTGILVAKGFGEAAAGLAGAGVGLGGQLGRRAGADILTDDAACPRSACVSPDWRRPSASA